MIRLARPLALLLAIGSSIATSSIHDDEPHVSAFLALHNAAGTPLIVDVHRLAPGWAPACEALTDAPDLLAELPFGDPTPLGIGPGQVVPLLDADTDPTACHVLRLSLDGVGERTVFIDGLTGVRHYPAVLGAPTDDFGPLISILPGALEPFRDGQSGIVRRLPEAGLPSCEGAEPWGWHGPTGAVEVLKRLDEPGCPAWLVDDGQADHVLSVCAPEPLAPFEVADLLDIVADDRFTRISAPKAGVSLRLASGHPAPWGLSVEEEGEPSCVVATGCEIAVRRDVRVRASDGREVRLARGEIAPFASEDRDGWLAIAGGETALATRCPTELPLTAAWLTVWDPEAP